MERWQSSERFACRFIDARFKCLLLDEMPDTAVKVAEGGAPSSLVSRDCPPSNEISFGLSSLLNAWALSMTLPTFDDGSVLKLLSASWSMRSVPESMLATWFDGVIGFTLFSRKQTEQTR